MEPCGLVVLGGKDECSLKLRAYRFRLENFFCGEIADCHQGKRLFYISQVSAREFIARRPRREHSFALLMLFKKMAGINVQLHKIFVSEIVFRRNFVRRIEEERQNKAD